MTENLPKLIAQKEQFPYGFHNRVSDFLESYGKTPSYLGKFAAQYLDLLNSLGIFEDFNSLLKVDFEESYDVLGFNTTLSLTRTEFYNRAFIIDTALIGVINGQQARINNSNFDFSVKALTEIFKNDRDKDSIKFNFQFSVNNKGIYSR